MRRLRRLLKVPVTITLYAVAFFGGAGRLDWTRGWITFVMYVVCMGATGLVVHRWNPGLLKARAKWRRKDTKGFDKVLLAIYAPLSFLQPAVAGLDVVRFHWSSMPFWTVYPGVLLLPMAMALITWVLVVNPHAESTVRIQSERGHVVVTSGPYRFVRHPMYVGAILLYSASALVLGSMWALAIAALIAALLICRAALEDGTLRRELPGYQEYTAQTQYRLIPGLW
jgi:protein-S-isoprenylcysteine O-methyltransferase Ste14